MIVSQAGWFHRVLGGGPTGVSFNGKALQIEGRAGTPAESIPFDEIDEIQLVRRWFRHRLTIFAANRMEREIGGLDYRAREIHDAIIRDVTRRAEEVGVRMFQLEEQLEALLDGTRYVRYSAAAPIHDAVVATVQRASGLVRTRLREDASAALRRLSMLTPEDEFHRVRSDTNARFISNSIPAVRASVGKLLSFPLTDEQAAAVATDEDVTLVLAGAGTGKTATIVGKVAHLVRNEQTEPDAILVLAYNKKAAKEIRERLSGTELSDVEVSTFHAFGRKVIASDAAPKVAKVAGDDYALKRRIETIVYSLLADPGQQDHVIDFLAYHNKPYRSAFDFRTRKEYEEYVRRVELRTLNNILVKSYEELLIANHLTEHGIRFEYEADYEVNTTTQKRRQYQPDFFLPDYDIYIEHFALDKQGRAPQGWSQYIEGVHWKRTIHRQYNTNLIETYSWQYKDDSLLRFLRTRLEEENVSFSRVSREKLVQTMGSRMFSWLSDLLATFLNHFKSIGLEVGELRQRARTKGDWLRNRSFVNVFEVVQDRYERGLNTENEIDFHDMINNAIRYLFDGRWGHPYRYILVDEFQDISRGRMKLLESLREWYPESAYFLVGDDWQSIYRFAGSDVGVLREVADGRSGLGHASVENLSLTFRFADGILSPSSEFVQKNPEQTRRPLRSVRTSAEGGITIVVPPRILNQDDNRKPNYRHKRNKWDSNSWGVQRSLQDIRQLSNDERNVPSVLVLGRYRNSERSLEGCPDRRSLRVEFSTVHTAKGREADFVVVLDLNRGGFPSTREDDPLLDLVLPPRSGTAYPYAEERRLFYVAMTRARKGTYLVTDQNRPSPFIRELIGYSPSLRQIGEPIQPCPTCADGVVRMIEGKYGWFKGCSGYYAKPPCRYTKSVGSSASDPSTRQ